MTSWGFTLGLIIALHGSSTARAQEAGCPFQVLPPGSPSQLTSIVLSGAQTKCSPYRIFDCGGRGYLSGLTVNYSTKAKPSRGVRVVGDPTPADEPRPSSDRITVSAYCAPILDGGVDALGRSSAPDSGRELAKTYGKSPLSLALTKPRTDSSTMSAAIPRPPGQDPGAGRAPTPRLSAAVRAKARELGLPEAVLERGFANYKALFAAGKTQRACFMAGDLTTSERAQIYTVCLEPSISVSRHESLFGLGYGAECNSSMFRNDQGCAKFFGNRVNSCLSAGGAYLTGLATQTKSAKSPNPNRIFVDLVGQEKGANDNAVKRRVGLNLAVNAKGEPIDKGAGRVAGSAGGFTLPSDLREFSITDLSSAAPGAGGMALYMYPSKDDLKQILDPKSSGDHYWSATCKSKIIKPAWIDRDGSALYDPTAMGKETMEYINKPSPEALDPQIEK